MTIDLPSQPGTYCLVFHCLTSSLVTIGKLGTYQIKLGYYCYIGSAFGRGGLKSRINRHLQINKRHHWHLDYLRPSLTTVEAWYSNDTIKREHQWANLLLEDDQSTIPITKFGSSDCDCPAHLFYYEERPRFDKFYDKIVETLPNHDISNKLIYSAMLNRI
ncbi:GIY-YIG nuclease family protein [Crocosphaera sp. UHCC 0190]|uniref:GIY-YIG nuclease family protein n=1 Tax=Crocosphaera sp. UHCC 0190 TaxID=3110246 RepID=UPI002B21657B|nr:GIY-YIG nuclease family protein [Crocosphaera sp. UHCC 0190]MEA5512237.1 GIY-YIG nuclease family protein [Crocosphaera sp. UHCC 0190]